MKAERSGFIWLLLGVFLLSGGLLADKWYRIYDQSLAAVKRGDWQQVITLINESLTKKDKPKVQARTVGMEFIDYFPFYYLGMAYYRLGQYENAKQAFEKSMDFAESSKKEEIAKSLGNMLADCRNQLVKKVAGSEPITEMVKPQPASIETMPSDEKKEEAISVTYQQSQIDVPVSVPQKSNLVKKGVTSTETEQAKDTDPLLTLKTDLNREAYALLKTCEFDAAQMKFNALLQLDAHYPKALKGLEKIKMARCVIQINQGIRLYFEGDIDGSERILMQALADRGAGVLGLVRVHQFLAIISAERYLCDADKNPKFLQSVRKHLREADTGATEFKPDSRFFSPKVIHILNESK